MKKAISFVVRSITVFISAYVVSVAAVKFKETSDAKKEA